MAMNPYLEFILQLMAQILGDGNDRKNFASRDIDWQNELMIETRIFFFIIVWIRYNQRIVYLVSIQDRYYDNRYELMWMQ